LSDGVATSFDRIAAHHSALDPPAAAVLAFVALRLSRPSALLAPSLATTLSPTPAAGPRQLTLSDGTVVRLNTGGQVIEQFTAAERRVLLARGEAHFAVTKTPPAPSSSAPAMSMSAPSAPPST
jgi:ferric-dicitrate binding protein FerR (iron transport regulator)